MAGDPGRRTGGAGRLWLCAVLMVWGTACTTMEIRTDYDPNVDFSQLRTWSWLAPVAPHDNDPRVDTPMVDKRVRTAVEEALAERGFARDDTAPSFYVAYYVALRDEVDVRELNDHYGYGPGWGWRYGYDRGFGWGPGGLGGYTYVYEYQKGSLTLDVVLPEDRRLVWRGSAEAEVQPDASPGQSDAVIREAVEKILARFPPPPPRPRAD